MLRSIQFVGGFFFHRLKKQLNGNHFISRRRQLLLTTTTTKPGCFRHFRAFSIRSESNPDAISPPPTFRSTVSFFYSLFL